jgi:hypothetical protein
VQIDLQTKRAFREDGVAKLEHFFNPEMLASLRACFDWTLFNPGPNAAPVLFSDGSRQHTDNHNIEGMPFYAKVVSRQPVAEMLQELWGSKHVWLLGEEIFYKEGNVPMTLWHQDTAYHPWGGEQWVNLWIPFCDVPRSHGLEVVRGSHHGIRYDGTAFDPSDPTLPLWGEAGDLPRLPDIEKERAADASSWDIKSFDVKRGDALVLHPGALHGGGRVDQSFSCRRTLVLRLHGDDAFWLDLPRDTSGLSESMLNVVNVSERGEPGSPMRDPRSVQLC